MGTATYLVRNQKNFSNPYLGGCAGWTRRTTNSMHFLLSQLDQLKTNYTLKPGKGGNECDLLLLELCATDAEKIQNKNITHLKD